MLGLMARFKELAIRVGWMRLNPRACAWIAYIGLVLVSIGAVLSIFLFFVPRDSCEWTRASILDICSLAVYAEVTGSLGLWGILCQLSQRVRQSAAVPIALSGIALLLCCALFVLFLKL